MAAFSSLDDLDATGKKVAVRVDLNVPMDGGVITDWTRIDRHKKTILELADKGARVILLAHFARPKGEIVPKMSLKPVAEALGGYLGRPIRFSSQTIGDGAQQAVAALAAGDILVMENLRFHPGEEQNDPAFADQLAALADAYVNDAFSAAHRAHASTAAIAATLPAYAGRAMEAELTALSRALGQPVRPVAAVVGGAKVSSKIALLENLVTKVDYLIIGGGMANTFLAAEGRAVGRSLFEPDLLDQARQIETAARANDCQLILPVDAVIAWEFAAQAAHRTVLVDDVPDDAMIVDVGPQSVERIGEVFSTAATIVWNGPLGAFELEPFDAATVAAARLAAIQTRENNTVSVAGGGDTVAALNHAGVAEEFSYISAAGGAFLEWMEGRELPGVAALNRASRSEGHVGARSVCSGKSGSLT